MTRSFIIAALFAAGLAGAASAQTSAPAPAYGTASFGNVYVGLATGAVVPDDVHQTLTGSVAGLPVSGAGNFSFKPGFMIDALLGYRYNDYLAAEADLGYAQYDDDQINGQISLGPLVEHRATVDGSAETWTGFANAIVTPLGRSRFTPYIGGGLGFSAYDAKLNSISSATFGTVAVNSTTSDAVLAVDAIVGFDYAVTEAFLLGARYRFLWTDSSRTSTSGGLTGTEDDALFQIFSLTATYRF
jgi:opacity protein-like surface antigen